MHVSIIQEKVPVLLVDLRRGSSYINKASKLSMTLSDIAVHYLHDDQVILYHLHAYLVWIEPPSVFHTLDR